MTLEKFKRISVIWLYALLLLMTVQLGVIIGIVFNIEVEVSRSLCLKDFEPVDKYIDLMTGKNTKIILTEKTNSKCAARAVEMKVYYRGSMFGSMNLDKKVSDYLSAREIQATSKSVQTKPAKVASTFYGFIFSAICAIAFLRYQRRKATLIMRPQLAAPFQVTIIWAAVCLTGFVALVWLPFQVFAEDIHIPNYLFDDGEMLQESITAWVYIVLLAPLCEEIIFRAWLLEAWRKFVGPWLALVMSAVAFSLVHPMGLVANLIFIIPGLLLGALWLKTRSLITCISTHALYNAFVLFMISYNT